MTDIEHVKEDVDLTSSAPELVDAEVQEQMLPQSKVNELIGRAKQTAAEKARKEVMHELEAQAQAQQAQAPQEPQQVPQAQAQPQQLDAEVLKNEIREQLLQEAEAERVKSEQEAYALEMNKVADSYFQKMGGGPEKYDDYKEVMESFNPSKYKHLVFLAAKMDNTLPLMYELAKNPAKLASIAYHAETDHEYAQKLLRDLDKSIVGNETALADNRSAAAPLSRLNPSSSAGGDNGAMTIRDFKAKYLA